VKAPAIQLRRQLFLSPPFCSGNPVASDRAGGAAPRRVPLPQRETKPQTCIKRTKVRDVSFGFNRYTFTVPGATSA